MHTDLEFTSGIGLHHFSHITDQLREGPSNRAMLHNEGFGGGFGRFWGILDSPGAFEMRTIFLAPPHQDQSTVVVMGVVFDVVEFFNSSPDLGLN